MRPLDKVIDAALVLSPKSFANRDQVEEGLKEIKEAYLEFVGETPDQEPDQNLVRRHWFYFTHFLNNTLGEPDVDWKLEIIELLQDKKDYQEILDG